MISGAASGGKGWRERAPNVLKGSKIGATALILLLDKKCFDLVLSGVKTMEIRGTTNQKKIGKHI